MKEVRAEEGDIPPADADLSAAEEDLQRAKARHSAAMRRLEKAQGDLREHDLEGQYASLTSDGAEHVSGYPAKDYPEGVSSAPVNFHADPSGGVPVKSASRPAAAAGS